MIGYIKGTVITKKPPLVIIDVHGLGYEVETSMTTFYQLPQEQQQVALYTHLVVREDAHLLYGFAADKERQLFRTLVKINGVGPKLALAMLSSITPEELTQMVVDQDSKALTRLPGVGKKTAQRLILELRDRFKEQPSSQHESEAPMSDPTSANPHAPEREAINALVALGYKPQEASRAIAKLETTAGLSSEALIRQALRQIGSS
jgi:Holliday junction DNA helicase RuvA